MGGATIWPVPRAIDAEAHYYPRNWKRNYLFLYASGFLMLMQTQRYAHLCRQTSMSSGEYMDWGSYNAPKRVRYTV